MICISAQQDSSATKVLIKEANKKGSPIYFINGENSLECTVNIPGEFQQENAQLAVSTLVHLNKFNIPKNDVMIGLQTVQWYGRNQLIQKNPLVIFDVAHNPAAIANLAAFIDKRHPVRRNLAVFSMLKDKDLAEVVRLMGSRIASWHLTQLAGSRASPLQDLADVVSNHSNADIKMWPNPLHAYKMAMQVAHPGDRVVVFGSFYLVGAILKSVSEDPLQA